MGKVSFPLHNVRKDILNNWHIEKITESIHVPEVADEYGFFTVFLTEIPESSASSPIKIEGLTEFRSSPYDSKQKKYVLPQDKFWVNYFNGSLLFHRNQAGNDFVVEYYGKGSLVEADDVNDLHERIEGHTTTLTEIQSSLGDLQQTVEDVNTLKSDVENINGSVESINDSIESINTALENKADNSALESAVDGVRTLVEGYVQEGGEVEEIVNSKLLDYTPAAEFTPVKEATEQNTTNIASLQESVEGIESIKANVEAVEANVERIASNLEAIESNTSRIGEVAGELETVKTAAGKNTEDIVGLTSRVETIEGGEYVTEEDLNDLASKDFVTEKISEIEIPDVSNFATKDELPSVEGLASEEFVTEKISEVEIPDVSGFATKEEIEGNVKSSSLSGLVAVDGANVSSAQHKIVTKKNDKNLTAMIWNEESGGGAQFKNEDADKVSFIGVNNGDGDSEIWVQGYAKKISNNTGARITLSTEGFYYTKNQANGSYTADDEVVVKKDLPEIPDVSNFATKDELPSVEGLASEEFVTEKISEIDIPDVSEFIKSEDVETAINNAGHVKFSELNGLVSVSGVNAASAQHKVITKSNNKNLTALLFNESDGGGSQFKNEEAGKISFIGVNNGAADNEIWVQGYAKNISTNIGTRLTLTTEGMYYTKNQANGSYTADDEIIVKKDVSNFVVPAKLSGLVAVDGVNVSSAQHKIITKKNDKNITSMLWNESSGGGTQMRNEDAGKVSFIGVNNGDGDNEIWVQGYAKNIANNTGARITLSTSGFFYTKNQANGSYTADNEVLTKSDLVDVNAQLENSYETSTAVDLLLNKIAVLEKKLADSRNQGNVVPQSVESATTTYNDETADMVFSGGEPVIDKTTVTAKSVDVQDMTAENASVSFKATDGDVTITNFENSGTLVKDNQGNAQVNVNTDEYVSISDCTFGANSYNGLEIGLSNTAPKSVTIDNCTFGGNLSNNAISIFAQADDAVITISNCTFENVSNVLRYSNRTNTKATISFVNCTFNKWESGSAYAGAIICQDYTNANAVACTEANLFAPEKVKISFVNCIGPDGNKIVGSSNPADYSGSGNDNQLLYVYLDKGGGVLAYSADRYPEVTFK